MSLREKAELKPNNTFVASCFTECLLKKSFFSFSFPKIEVTASSSGASIRILVKGERETRVLGDEARGTTGRRKKRREAPARFSVDFLTILSFSCHRHFSDFLSLGSARFW